MSKAMQSPLLDGAPVIPLNVQIAKVLGICHALLLQQIHYSTETQPVKRGGRNWCYYTHEEWASRIGVYESRTIRKALADLVTIGLVVIGKHNVRKYDRTNWYAVDYMRLSSWVGEVGVEGKVSAKVLSTALLTEVNSATSIGQKMPIPSGKKCHMDTAQNAGPIHKKINKNLVEDVTDESQPQNPTPEVSENMPAPTSTKALLSAFKDKKAAEAGIPPKITAEGLGQLWVREVAKLPDTHGCLPPLTMKDKGHFGKLATAWGDKAPAIIRAVVRNWITFAKGVAEDKALKSFPTKPLIGFLLSHFGAAEVFSANAVNCMSHHVPEPIPPVQSPAFVVPLVPKVEKEVPMTIEEMQAILKGS